MSNFAIGERTNLGISLGEKMKTKYRADGVGERSHRVKEAYNTLRSNITISLQEKGCKIIGVTSAVLEEGNSEICLNLARSFSEYGYRVLIIESLRSSNFAEFFGLNASPGISNVLMNFISLEDVIHTTGYAGLDVVLSGDIPPSASNLLGSDKMGEVFGELSKWYDYIFVDIPPVNVVPDVIILSGHLTGVIVVVKQGKSEKKEVALAVKQLEFAKTKILGFALNGVPKKRRELQAVESDFLSKKFAE